MATLKRATRMRDSKNYLVNLDLVKFIETSKDATRLNFVDGTHLLIDESADTIARLQPLEYDPKRVF